MPKILRNPNDKQREVYELLSAYIKRLAPDLVIAETFTYKADVGFGSGLTNASNETGFYINLGESGGVPSFDAQCIYDSGTIMIYTEEIFDQVVELVTAYEEQMGGGAVWAISFEVPGGAKIVEFMDPEGWATNKQEAWDAGEMVAAEKEAKEKDRIDTEIARKKAKGKKK